MHRRNVYIHTASKAWLLTPSIAGGWEGNEIQLNVPLFCWLWISHSFSARVIGKGGTKVTVPWWGLRQRMLYSTLLQTGVATREGQSGQDLADCI